MRTFVKNFMNIAADVLLWSTVKLMLKYGHWNPTYLGFECQ